MQAALSPDGVNRAIGLALKKLRAARGLSLDACAACTGVSKAMLGQIERGESSPTVATMWKLASGLAVPFTSFWENLAADEASWSFHDSEAGMRASVLQPYDAQTGIEILLVELAPGCLRQSQPHQRGLVEYVLAFEGTIDVFHDGRWRTLSQGQTTCFAADGEHGYRNAGSTVARFHNVLCHVNR